MIRKVNPLPEKKNGLILKGVCQEEGNPLPSVFKSPLPVYKLADLYGKHL